MSILQQILLSLFAVSCATTPPQQPSQPEEEVESPIEESQSEPQKTLTPRELFAEHFAKEYPEAVQNGYIYQSIVPAQMANRTLYYRLEYENLRLFTRPDKELALALEHDKESQQYEHARLMRDFFKSEMPMISNVQDAQVWVKWLEGFLYQGDLLIRKEDALQLFLDEDRLIASINPFFYVDFDGRNYSLDYFTMQDNTLWQKRITVSPYGEIVQFQQDPLDLERRGVL